MELIDQSSLVRSLGASSALKLEWVSKVPLAPTANEVGPLGRGRVSVDKVRCTIRRSNRMVQRLRRGETPGSSLRLQVEGETCLRSNGKCVTLKAPPTEWQTATGDTINDQGSKRSLTGATFSFKLLLAPAQRKSSRAQPH